MVLTPSTMLPLGKQAPDFSLPNVDGKTVSLANFKGAPALLVVFMCNHCPYVKHVADGVARFAKDYAGRGLACVAINPNDAERYPADSLDAMRRFAREQDWPMPYLHDEAQDVARALGAARTPHVYVLDGEQRLAYRGAPDGDHQDPGQDARWLRDALDAVLAGSEPERAETPARGCSVKWRGA